VPTDAGVSDAAAALARRKHERAREVETDRPVRMVDLHDLERATDERLSELDRRFAAVRAPAVPGTVPAPAAPVLAPRRRLSAVAPWVAVAVLLAVVVVAYVRGTRGGTR
jgi:ferric-dicitrate binding protein FerR (iron transport regulator)